ncbi:MAG: DNA polymerase III subunit chi [Rhizobiales bacterium]|nr:DNA polymerase III subunit chi [Hyphomicrobiales bacterium]NRB12993.1 DNA polymerase III subunit chi [Hyphomicrobiales bacterium]
MTEVSFYHLETKPLDLVLPELIEKCYERDWKTYIQCADKVMAQHIDKLLWSFKPDSFVPHGLDEAPQAQRKNFDKQQYAAQQPILIGTQAHNPNGASVRFLLAGCDIVADDISNYQRIIVMFDGTDESAVNAARDQWKTYKSLPANAISAITYWQQDMAGKWQKKA